MTRCQKAGDSLAIRARQDTRRTISVISAKEIRISLFRSLHGAWTSPSAILLSIAAARKRVEQLTPGALETLLLRAIEEFSFGEIGTILHRSEAEASELFEIALRERPYQRGKKVLIIEDDALIAMDIANCISEMGGIITGVARTATQAVELAGTYMPQMILTSPVLADRSSGLEAAKTISAGKGGIDVVVVSPDPQTLLQGEPAEPLFVLEKPYLEDQVRSAVRQAFILSQS